MLQRDGFIDEIYKALETDKDIYFLSADFGAAALDDLRVRYKDNFIHCGISEQNMIDVAVGLALESKKVFCYAMAPFIFMLFSTAVPVINWSSRMESTTAGRP